MQRDHETHRTVGILLVISGLLIWAHAAAASFDTGTPINAAMSTEGIDEDDEGRPCIPVIIYIHAQEDQNILPYDYDTQYVNGNPIIVEDDLRSEWEVLVPPGAPPPGGGFTYNLSVPVEGTYDIKNITDDLGNRGDDAAVSNDTTFDSVFRPCDDFDNPFDDELGPGGIIDFGPCPEEENDPFAGGGSSSGPVQVFQDPPAPPDLSGFSDSFGDGLHLQYTTGNIWTVVPILRTHVDDGPDTVFSLRYDSLRANEDEGLGFGWTHNYNQYLTTHGDTTVVFHGSSGRRHAFHYDAATGEYSTPKGRMFTLSGEPGTFTLATRDGVTRRFDSNNRLFEVEDAQGRITRLYYHATSELLETIVTGYGRTITLEYDTQDRLWKITDPDDKTTILTYTSGKLTTITDPLSHTITYEYEIDGSHRVKSETLKNSVKYTVEYGDGVSAYRQIKDDPPAPETSSIIAKVSSASGFPMTRTTPILAGEVTFTDGLGQDWTIERDAHGRTWEVTSPNGKRSRFVYANTAFGVNRGRLIHVENERGYARHYYYNDHGKVSAVQDEGGYRHEYEYAPAPEDWTPGTAARRTKRIEPDGDEWIYEHDSSGRISRVIDPDSAQIVYDYVEYEATAAPGSVDDPLPGRVQFMTETDREGNDTRYEFSGHGNLIKTTRDYGTTGELNLVTDYDHDPMGRVTQIAVPRAEANDDVVTDYTYDALGRVLTMTERLDAVTSLTTTFAYLVTENAVTVTDPRGNVTRNEGDHRFRRCKRIVDVNGLGLTTEWEFDGNNNLIEVTDTHGDVTSYVHNEQNFLTTITDAEGYVSEFTPDAVGNNVLIKRSEDPNPTGETRYFTVEMEYDALNRVVRITEDPNGLARDTLMEYDDPAGCSCGAATPSSQSPHKITDPMGKVSYAYYDNLDRLEKVVRKVGDTLDNGGDTVDDAVYRVEFDANGNVTASVGPEGERTEFNYDGADRRAVARVIVPGAANLETVLGYDEADNVVSVTLPNGNEITTVFDGASRPLSASDSEGSVGVIRYDANSNIEELRDGQFHEDLPPGADSWQYVFHYDGADRLIQLDDMYEALEGRHTSYNFDDVNNKLLITNKKGVQFEYEFDGLGRMTRKVEDVGLLGTTTQWAYNGISLVNSMTDHDGNATLYEYDDVGRSTKITYPDTGYVGFGYDDITNTKARTDQKNVTTTYAYNDLHHLITRSYSSDDPDDHFLYDRSGRMTSADNTVVEVDFAYDGVGRLEHETHEFVSDGRIYDVQRSYDYTTTAWTDTVGYPGGRDAVRSYDARFRLESVNGDNGTYTGSNTAVSWLYDLANRRKTASRANNVPSVFQYNDNGWLTEVSHGPAGSELYKVLYGYDSVGNRLWMDNQTPGLANRSESYSYDNLNRLTNFRRGTIDPDTHWITPVQDPVLPDTKSWILDARGNWTAFTMGVGTGGSRVNPLETRLPNDVNEYDSIDPDLLASPPDPVLPDHDDNGNRTCDPTAPNAGPGIAPGQIYSYDAENRLTKVERTVDTAPPCVATQIVAVYRYDALGRRVESEEHIDPVTGSPLLGPSQITRHIHDGLTVVEEYDVSDDGVGGTRNHLDREFLWGDRFPEPITMIDHTEAGAQGPAQGEVLHYLHDALGSVVALTNATGAVVERYTYDPYGTTYIENVAGEFLSVSAYGNPWMWTGQRYDATTRLYHFLFRSYSPRLGRWLQRDPAGYVDGVSLYEYAASSPLSFSDPLGLQRGGNRPETPQEELDRLVGEVARLNVLIRTLENELRLIKAAIAKINEAVKPNSAKGRRRADLVAQRTERETLLREYRSHLERVMMAISQNSVFRSWADRAWGKSIDDDDREYGFWVYLDKHGHARARRLTRGTGRDVGIPNPEAGDIFHVHTHPRTPHRGKGKKVIYDHNYGPSGQDRGEARRYRRPGFVIFEAPNGERIYYPYTYEYCYSESPKEGDNPDSDDKPTK